MTKSSQLSKTDKDEDQEDQSESSESESTLSEDSNNIEDMLIEIDLEIGEQQRKENRMRDSISVISLPKVDTPQMSESCFPGTQPDSKMMKKVVRKLSTP